MCYLFYKKTITLFNLIVFSWKGEGSRIYQRNYQDQFEHEYKQAGRSPHEPKDYKQTLKE